MRLSKQTRQVIGAVIGAAIAALISTGFAMPSVDRHKEPFRTVEQPAP